MRKAPALALFVGTSLVLLTVSVTLALSQSAGSQAPTVPRPWMIEKHPTTLEWLWLELQASERDHDWGDNHTTVNFRLETRSYAEGVIFCDIRHGPKDADMAESLEGRIKMRFAERQKRYPWARIEFTKDTLKLP